METHTLTYKTSRLKVITDKKEAISTIKKELITQRTLIETYADKEFLNSLVPIKTKKDAPEIIREMAMAAKIAKVGPMAAVAGTLAEFSAKKAIALHNPETLIIENGGDIYAYTKSKINIGLFSGNNKLKDKLCFHLTKENTPISICSSSSNMGHSLSLGKCDLAVIFSKKASVADALATATANKVKTEKDIKKTLDWLKKRKYFEGAIIIKDKKIGLIGNIPKLTKNQDPNLETKITKL